MEQGRNSSKILREYLNRFTVLNLIFLFYFFLLKLVINIVRMIKSRRLRWVE
jgi:hypothetical protein